MYVLLLYFIKERIMMEYCKMLFPYGITFDALFVILVMSFPAP